MRKKTIWFTFRIRCYLGNKTVWHYDPGQFLCEANAIIST